MKGRAFPKKGEAFPKWGRGLPQEGRALPQQGRADPHEFFSLYRSTDEIIAVRAPYCLADAVDRRRELC